MPDPQDAVNAAAQAQAAMNRKFAEDQKLAQDRALEQQARDAKAAMDKKAMEEKAAIDRPKQEAADRAIIAGTMGLIGGIMGAEAIAGDGAKARGQDPNSLTQDALSARLAGMSSLGVLRADDPGVSAMSNVQAALGNSMQPAPATPKTPDNFLSMVAAPKPLTPGGMA